MTAETGTVCGWCTRIHFCVARTGHGDSLREGGVGERRDAGGVFISGGVAMLRRLRAGS